MELIDDVGRWHKLWSMRLIILTTFLTSVAAAYAVLPDDWMPAVPAWLKATLAISTVLTAGAAGVARVVKQPQE